MVCLKNLFEEVFHFLRRQESDARIIAVVRIYRRQIFGAQ